MAGLVPAISIPDALSGIEIPGTRPGMTSFTPFKVPDHFATKPYFA
jgi:hypothetical protein